MTKHSQFIHSKQITISKIYISWTLILVLGFSSKINAQSTITMSQAINNGLVNKKNIIAGRLETEISKLQTKALMSKYWPQISAEYNYTYNPILQTSILPIGIFNPAYDANATKSVQFGTKWSQSAGIAVNQPLLDLSIKKHINEASLQERIANLSQEQTEYELAYTIAQTYIDIFLEEAKIKLLIIDTNRTFISFNLLNNKFNENRLLKSDLNKSKINHNNTVQLLRDEIMLLIEDKVYLLFLMGNNDIERWDLTIDTSITTDYSIQNTVNLLNLDLLPDLQKLTLQSQLCSLQTNSEKTKYLPTISLKGYLGGNQYTNSFNPVEKNSWFGLSYLGLSVKFPILFGENHFNKIQQLQLQSNQYNLQKESKTLQYTKDSFTEKLKIMNVKNQLKSKKENIKLSFESIEIFQNRVREGQETPSNLNLEEANLQELEINYEITNKQLWVCWLDYLKNSGQLSVLWK